MRQMGKGEGKGDGMMVRNWEVGGRTANEELNYDAKLSKSPKQR